MDVLHMENKKLKQLVTAVSVVFCIAVLAIAAGINFKAATEQQQILADSLTAQLLTTAKAARNIVSEYPFWEYTSQEAIEADGQAYDEMRERLRDLARSAGAEYIYVLKYVGGECRFVVDTDPQATELLLSYPVGKVHVDAFSGKESAGVNNLVDSYGTFHTGAIPLWHNDQVAGVISVDMEDEHYQQSVEAARRNAVILVVVLAVTMGVMLAMLGVVMKRLNALQARLQQLAHYDNVTGLPNRQYLFEYLDRMDKTQPYALFFIDMDNFKSVNDNAGHDAGDDLLRYVANYMQQATGEGKAFRPAAGALNVSARVGGDEFVQVVPGISTAQQADALAKELVEGFARNNHNRYVEKYAVGLSVGVALYPFHSEQYHVLIKYADIAMYHAKHAGKNSWRVYNDEMRPKEEK